VRLATVILRPNPQPPVSEDPAEMYEYGVTPQHRLTGPVFIAGRNSVPDFGGMKVRLPRRLSRLPAEDAHRWVRGDPPRAIQGTPTRWGTCYEWEHVYPGRGLGLPKPLPHRRARRIPLTAHDLRERVAKLEAAGYRPMADGYFHQQLTMEEIFEVRADTEYLLMERGRVNALPDGCHGEIGNIRIYLRPSMSDVFDVRMRQLGEAAGNALNELVRRRLLESRDEFARVRPALDLAIQAIKRSALGLVEGRVLSEIWQMTIGEQLAGIGHRTLYEHGVTDVRLDVRLVNDPHGRGLVDPARPTLGLKIWPRWLVP